MHVDMSYKAMFLGSLPVRERGLKFLTIPATPNALWVAPCAGAWIEIDFFKGMFLNWIKSLPVRERGLKYKIFEFYPAHN